MLITTPVLKLLSTNALMVGPCQGRCTSVFVFLLLATFNAHNRKSKRSTIHFLEEKIHNRGALFGGDVVHLKIIRV
jgi:hypothetical protein